ncbi:MAG: outer membrane beta-barrel protein, partial [Aquificaceae bacterium]
LEPIGKLNISGALTGYTLYTNNKVGTEKKISYDVGSALINISKPSEPVGFILVGGAYALPVVGVEIGKTTDATKLFSPLPVAYIEAKPHRNISLQVGKLPTIIGYESAFTYLNNHIQRGLVWNMQTVINNGVRVAYGWDIFSIKVGINDGFYTLGTKEPKPAFEGSISLSPTKESSLSFNFLIPDKDAKPNSTANPSNKREYNIVSSYAVGDLLSFGLDLLYVEAPKSTKAGVPERAKASAAAFHISYKLDPVVLSGRVEYVKDDSDAGAVDLVGLKDGNKGWTFTLTPYYAKKHLFVRGEWSYVNADRPFTSNNKKKQTRLGLEVGLMF